MVRQFLVERSRRGYSAPQSSGRWKIPNRGWPQLPVDSYRMLELPAVPALAPYYRDWVAHERDDDYWSPWKISTTTAP